MGNNGLTKAESCFSPKCCFREPVPCLSTVQLPTRSCSSVTSVAFIVSFQVLYFNLPLYSRHTKLPDRNGPEARSFRRGAIQAGHGMSRRAARPSSSPAQAAASFKLAVAAVASADSCIAATVPGAARPTSPLEPAAVGFKLAAAEVAAADVCFSLPSPPEAPAAAMSQRRHRGQLLRHCRPRRRRPPRPRLRRQ